MFPTCPPIHTLDHVSLQSLPWELEWFFGSTDAGFGCVICFGQRNVSDGKWAQTFKPSVGLGWSSVLLLFPKGRHASGYHWSAENKELSRVALVLAMAWCQPSWGKPSWVRSLTIHKSLSKKSVLLLCHWVLTLFLRQQPMKTIKKVTLETSNIIITKNILSQWRLKGTSSF